MSKSEEKINGETVKPDKRTVRLEFAIPLELYNQLEKCFGVESHSMSTIIEQALASFVANTDEAEVSNGQNQQIYTCEHYDKLLEINPKDYKAWYGRGVVLKNLGSYEEAIASLDKALEIKSDFHKAWYARGNALYGLDFYEEAIVSYDKALELKPGYPEALYYRSKALDELGFHEEAIASYEKVIELTLNHPKARYYRDKALDKLARDEYVIASLNKAIEIKPETTNVLCNSEPLQAVIESFVDGILILTNQHELLHANEYARQICRQMGDGSTDTVPEEIWRVCQSLIDSREVFPGEKIVLESEIETDTVKLRIRARWLSLAASEQNLMLVILEDCNQTSQSLALSDAKKYGLSDREAEVWLLRQANLSYREIAQKLYVTINTVKKHLKNIYAKQQAALWNEE